MLHEYEKTQNFNKITQILHSTRYNNLAKLVRQLSQEKSNINVVDIGCGTAKSYELLKKLGINFDYLGVELREDFVKLANTRYGDNNNFKIICDSIENHLNIFDSADLIIGLESFEHIPEWLVVRVIENICSNSFSYLYITVPNEIGPAVFIKNVGSFLMGYSRYKEYRWSETLSATFYKLDKVERHSDGHKGFDWRWLAQTLRQNCKILRITKSPLDVVPAFISPSIGFICQYKPNQLLQSRKG